MARIDLSDLDNLENQTTATGAINSNNELLEEIMDKAVFRTGETPNHMLAELDMNSNKIINLPQAVDANDPVRVQDLPGLMPDIAVAEADIAAAEAAAVTAQNAAAQAINAANSINVGTIASQNANNVNITGGSISGVSLLASFSDPVSDPDVANKKYSSAQNPENMRLLVRVATTGTLPNSPTYTAASGTALAKLTATTNGALSIDGVTLSVGDRVLVKDQATALHNDVYTVTSVGSGGSTWLLTRAADVDNNLKGEVFYVNEGTANAGKSFARTDVGRSFYTDAIALVSNNDLATKNEFNIKTKTLTESIAKTNSDLTTSINNTNLDIITPGTIGDSSSIPVITYNSKGKITSATSTAIGGSLFFVNCDTTGNSDVTTAIQNKINAAKAAGGGTVILPAGTLLVNGGLSVDAGIIIQGQGWEEFKGGFASAPGIVGERGTYIKQTTNAASVFTIENTHTGAIIRDLAIYQVHPADAPGWTPTVYPWCFECRGSNSGQVSIEHVLLFGVYNGVRVGGPQLTITGAANNGAGAIRLTVGTTDGLKTGDGRNVFGVTGTTEANGFWTVTVIDGTHIDLQGSTFTNAYVSGGKVDFGAAGRVRLRHLHGDCYNIGIQVQCAADVCRFSDVHLYNFTLGDLGRKAYRFANTIGLDLFRSDTSSYDGIFVIGTAVGIQVSATGDGNTLAWNMWNNVGLDACKFPIIIHGSSCKMQMNNVLANGDWGLPGGVFTWNSPQAIVIDGNDCVIQGSNWNFEQFGTNAIHVAGVNNDLAVTNLRTEAWGGVAGSAGALDSTSTTNKITVGGRWLKRMVAADGTTATSTTETSGAGAASIDLTHCNHT